MFCCLAFFGPLAQLFLDLLHVRLPVCHASFINTSPTAKYSYTKDTTICGDFICIFYFPFCTVYIILKVLI